MRFIPLFLFLILLSGCAKTTDEKILGAIDIALTRLSEKKCDEAIEVLEGVNGSSNAVYIQVLASAYACKGNYNEISFIIDDLQNISASNPEELLKSISTFNISTETTTDSITAVNLTRASQIALNGKSQSERESVFGVRKSGDLGVQALLLNIAGLGKFIHYYGNVDSVGEKGSGPQANKCFLNYTDPRALNLIGVTTGACTSATLGHPDLNINTAVGKRRICEGLMYFTNSIDILENIDLSNFEEFDVVTDIAAQLEILKQAAHSQGLGSLIEELSQNNCQSSTSNEDMEYLYSMIFETSLK